MTDGLTPGKAPTIPLPPDPMYSVWIWRQDSQLLARMRPIIEEFLHLVEVQHCDMQDLGADQPCIETDLPPGQWCFRCRYLRLSNQLKGLP